VDTVYPARIIGSYYQLESQEDYEMERRTPALANELAALSSLYAIVYHEARYTRRLEDKNVKKHLAGLDRVKAWRELQTTRLEARNAATPTAARHVFERDFGIGLRELIPFFLGLGAHSMVGGERWANIASVVADYGAALESGEIMRARDLRVRALRMEHNSRRTVGNKILDLDRKIGMKA
jgi:hypothetical protein